MTVSRETTQQSSRWSAIRAALGAVTAATPFRRVPRPRRHRAADPTSPWQPASAPEMDAFTSTSDPIAVAVRRHPSRLSSCY
ncbi:hypothetical protein [Rhodococcus tibetensis]|uniref:hypothetical protein n=1 Tax=Rhodococcus tibetensis TaxID=2965064 RepID=UPI00403FAC19